MKPLRLLVVEDDVSLRRGLVETFTQEGYEVVAVGSGDEGRIEMKRGRFALIVLDVMLPGRSGFELVKELRERDTETKVLMLTARGDESDKVLGLELGADDYLTKPFGLRELIARVRAQLRRVEPAARKAERFTIGNVEVDLAAFRVLRDGHELPLSPTEAAMLALLHAEADKAVPRDRFLAEVWHGGMHVGNRTIDTHMLNLRQKIEADPRNPRHLLTVHGVGYRLVLGP